MTWPEEGEFRLGLAGHELDVRTAGSFRLSGDETQGAVYLSYARTSQTPLQFSLSQCYPNPFNPATVIEYALPSAAHVRLSVHTMLGQEVATLVNEAQEAGSRRITFNAANLPSGIYTYRLAAGTYLNVKKMIVLK